MYQSHILGFDFYPYLHNILVLYKDCIIMYDPFCLYTCNMHAVHVLNLKFLHMYYMYGKLDHVLGTLIISFH